MKEGHESMVERTEMRMVKWMCGTSLREKKTSVELRDRMGIETIGSVLKRNRLRWFGLVEKKEKGLNEEIHVFGGGVCKVKREAKTWLEMVRKDMKGSGLASVDALDNHTWKRKTVGDAC